MIPEEFSDIELVRWFNKQFRVILYLPLTLITSNECDDEKYKVQTKQPRILYFKSKKENPLTNIITHLHIPEYCLQGLILRELANNLFYFYRFNYNIFGGQSHSLHKFIFQKPTINFQFGFAGTQVEFSFIKTLGKSLNHAIGFGVEIPLPEENDPFYSIDKEEEPIPIHYRAAYRWGKKTDSSVYVGKLFSETQTFQFSSIKRYQFMKYKINTCYRLALHCGKSFEDLFSSYVGASLLHNSDKLTLQFSSSKRLMLLYQASDFLSVNAAFNGNGRYLLGINVNFLVLSDHLLFFLSTNSDRHHGNKKFFIV